MKIYKKIDKIRSKIDKYRPFEGHLLEQARAYYRVRLTYTSNAIEGNSLTESETKTLLEYGLTVGGKPLRDTFETLGHAKAYDFAFSLLKNSGVTENDILTMHRMFYGGIDEKNAGVYRAVPIIVTGSKYGASKPHKIKGDMDELFRWVNIAKSSLHPVELAAGAHKRFAFIHPFIDGNGRIARLIMNVILIQNGYIPAVIPPVLRQEYISLLEKAHTDDIPFTEFIAERVYESEKEMERLFGA